MTTRLDVRITPPWFFGCVLALVATFLLFLLIRSYEGNSANASFQTSAINRVNKIQDGLDDVLLSLIALGGYYDASLEIDRNQFRRLTQPFLDKELPIQALEWVAEDT